MEYDDSVGEDFQLNGSCAFKYLTYGIKNVA